MSFKKIGKRNIAGEKGMALIHRIVSQMEYGFHPSNQAVDAGIDGFIEIRDAATERATAQILSFQSKVESGPFTAETDSTFEFLCRAEDIDYWMEGNTPIILIVSRPDRGEAYWVSIKDYFSDMDRRKSRRVIFDKKTQRFDPACRSALANHARPTASGLYLSPVPKAELLYSNMLRVSRIAETMYVASTDYRKPDEIFAVEKEKGWHLSGEWFLTSSQIVSFHNLRDEPWRQLCDVGTVEAFGTDEWSASDDPDRIHEFTRLLGRCLKDKIRRLGVAYRADEGVYYFMPALQPGTRFYEYQSLARKTRRKVYSFHKANEVAFDYYRHTAFKGQFRRYEGTWYLIIMPTYFYTTDGKTPYRFGESLLKGIKRLERHPAVFGQVVTWAALLTQKPDLFSIAYPFLEFDSLVALNTDFGISDADWLSRESSRVARRAEKSLLEEGLFG